MRSVIAAVAMVLSLVARAADVEVKREARTPRAPVERPNAELLQLYDSLTDLPLRDQRDQTWGLSSKTKAALWTWNIERYLRDHPELSPEAQDVLRQGIRLVTTPAFFDIQPDSFGYELQVSALENLKRQIAAVVPPAVIEEVFIRLGPQPTWYPDLTTPASRPPVRADYVDICYCSGSWECGSNSSYSCHDSYCEPTWHCGVFHWEWCWGKCKSNG
jgi:hypothetical protein